MGMNTKGITSPIIVILVFSLIKDTRTVQSQPKFILVDNIGLILYEMRRRSEKKSTTINEITVAIFNNNNNIA